MVQIITFRADDMFLVFKRVVSLRKKRPKEQRNVVVVVKPSQMCGVSSGW